MTLGHGRRTILIAFAAMAALAAIVATQSGPIAAQPAGSDLFDRRPRLEQPLPAGSTLLGWQGVAVESTALLDAHPGIDRVWTFDAETGWIVDAPGIPAAVRRSFPITAGTGLLVIASEPVTLRVPLPPGPVRLSAAADGARLVVDPDVEIDLFLRGNPSTGFDWQVVDTADLLRLELEDFTPDSELIGAGGIARFSYRTDGAGETTLDLAYQRAFEPEPLTTHAIDVAVVGPASGPFTITAEIDPGAISTAIITVTPTGPCLIGVEQVGLEFPDTVTRVVYLDMVEEPDADACPPPDPVTIDVDLATPLPGTIYHLTLLGPFARQDVLFVTPPAE